MDPSVAVPLQFTIDAVGLVAAALVVVWASGERRWLGVAGGVLLAASQAVFAAQLVTPADGAWGLWSVVRLAGVAMAVAPGLRLALDIRLLVPAAGALGAGGVWQWLSDGVPHDLAAGARVLMVVGAVSLGVWTWRRAGSVRLRITASLVAVLGVAVVVAGSAVLRVATSDALSAAQDRLDTVAAAERQALRLEADTLLAEGAVTSALVALAASPTDAVVEVREQTLAARSFVVLVRPDGTLEGVPDLEPAETDPVARSPAVTSALGAGAATSIVPVGGGAALLAATPVFSPPDSRAAADVAWALVIGQRISADRMAELADRAGPGTVASLVADEREVVASRTAARDDDALLAQVPVDTSTPPATRLVLSRPTSAVAEGATSLPRALVGSLLAAALLAVVVTMWVSARLARPVLDAVEGAERVKSQFLDSLSHELRTPLTPIRGYTSLLRDRRGRRAPYLDEIDDAARRLERIVTLLVDVAAVQAGRYVVSPEPFDGGALLRELAERWTTQAPGHRFVVRAPKSLPQPHGDRAGIARVVDELVDNAVKFSPDGGAVELRARRMGDDVELSVTDEGIGLDPEQVEALSAAFVQAEGGPTRRFGGLGLGLTYAAGVLAAHGTGLGVRSEPGGGAGFAFSLPTQGMVARMPNRARVR